jgi:amidophosphoribosyltransferase
MCGVLGVISNGEAGPEIYQGLLTLQHRGQDGAGIITYNGMFHLKKGMGLALGVFNEKNLSRLKGGIGIGHVRYPTIGPGRSEDVQPFSVNTPFGIAMAHNGNVTNYWELKRELAEKSLRNVSSHCDVEVILNVFADELARQKLSRFTVEAGFNAVGRVFKRVEGCYSVAALIAGYGLLAFRDPYGIRPLVVGKKEHAYAFASEPVAFDLLGYELIRDVAPGEAIFVDTDLNVHSRIILGSKTHTPCIFEYIYFARPDSVLDSIGVYEARLRLGEHLALECRQRGIKPEVVVPVPDTARAAAASLARVLGVELREGFIKNRYIARTFIMPTPEQRLTSVRQKLNPIRSEIEGKRVLLVDDSIVRGTTSKEIVSLVKNKGAKVVYFAVTCPPLRSPCVYGIDMSTRGEFIAKTRSISEIEKLIGADALIYQTLDGMIEGVRGGDKNRRFCTACFTGEYPTGVSQKALDDFEKDRTRWQKG